MDMYANAHVSDDDQIEVKTIRGKCTIWLGECHNCTVFLSQKAAEKLHTELSYYLGKERNND